MLWDFLPVIFLIQCILFVSSHEILSATTLRFGDASKRPSFVSRSTVFIHCLRGGGSAVRSLQSKSEFDEVLKTAANKLVVVDFTATWCGPCQRISPVVDLLSSENPGVIFVKVDVDANEETSAACGVTCMPTFQFYKQGLKVDEFSGAEEAKLRDLIKKHG